MYLDKAVNYIKSKEGFSPKTYYDINAWRLGYGSDTITNLDGTFRKVLFSDTTSVALASLDLRRRVEKEFLPILKWQVGEQIFNSLTEGAKIGLLSLVYNYGSITHHSIINAVKSGNMQLLHDTIISETVNDLNSDDNRRIEEANFCLTPDNVFINSIPGALASFLIIGFIFTIWA